MSPKGVEAPRQGDRKEHRSLILGLTGSLGSGKTFVSSLMTDANAAVICADAVAREAVEPGAPAYSGIVQAFGPQILKTDGHLDRAKLARIVFADQNKRRQLEEIVHPQVRARERQLIEEYRDTPLIVLDVPLLFETAFDEDCDRTLVVLVTGEERYRRLWEAREMTREEVDARLAHQMPQEEKARRADFLVDNSSNRQYTCIQVRRLLARLFPGGLPQPLKLPAAP